MVFLGDDRAALTAAIYAARAGLDPVVFETMEGVEEAWDGEEAFVSSLEKQKRVRDAMRTQATKSGAACHPRDDPVTRVDVSEGSPFTVRTKHGVVLSARTLVVSEACAIATSLSSANDAAKEKTRSSVRGAFVARGSGFAAGLAAERWHGPVTSPSTLSNPIGTAFAETARKVRAAVADVSATPFERAGRSEDALPGETRATAFPLGKKKSASSSSLDFDPRAVRHTGADAFRRLYAGVCVFARDRGDVRERGNAETDCSGTTADGTTAGLKTKTKTDETVFALVAFFGAEGCAPCARVRPMLASVVDEYDRDRVRFVEMDVEADADMADALGVAGTPFALFYRVEARSQKTDAVAVERVAAVVGGKTKRAYRDALDAILGEDARVDGPRRRFS
jgi:thiol-disulfide isomerase/thioredoxin